MYCEVKTDTLNKVLYGLNIESKALNIEGVYWMSSMIIKLKQNK